MLIISLMRISKQYQKLKQHGIATRSDFVWRIGLVSVLHFAWPLLVLYLLLKVLLRKVFVMFQPDLGYWLEAVAMIVFVKGLLK